MPDVELEHVTAVYRDGTIALDDLNLKVSDGEVLVVVEGDALYPHLTADGNLRFGLEVRGTPKTEIDDRVRAESRILGLRPWLHRRPATLSAGERQRVA